MSHITIRFNKNRGQPGRGTLEHVWRVFNEGQEYIVKKIIINVQSYGEKEHNGNDWNIACDGVLEIHKETSTAVINPFI